MKKNPKPGEVICKLAKDVNANLIVMGSRGMGKVTSPHSWEVLVITAYTTPIFQSQ